MNSERSTNAQTSPQFVVSDLRPEQLKLIIEAVAQAADGGAGDVRITSPEDAERLIDRVLQGLCQMYPVRSREGLYRHVVRIVDRSMVRAVLGRVDGCQVRAAEILGISRNTLRSKMKDLGIEREDFGG
jgi:DNA-binding protein Fis